VRNRPPAVPPATATRRGATACNVALWTLARRY
jgi:hypothetical protein